MNADPFDTPSTGNVDDTGVRRSKDGRPYVWSPDEKKEIRYTRCTTFIDALDDKFMIHQWSERMLLAGLRDNGELQRELAVVPDDRDALNELAGRAKIAAGTKEAARHGTILHEATQAADDGEPIPLSDIDVSQDVEAYLSSLQQHRLVPLETEVFVVDDDARVAGTFDRIYSWYRDGWDEPPLRVIGDLKTGSLDFGAGKLPMQLAQYARSWRYSPSQPLLRQNLNVSQDVGLIVHLPAGTGACDVYAADLAMGREGLELAAAVRRWRSATRNVANVLDKLETPARLSTSA